MNNSSEDMKVSFMEAGCTVVKDEYNLGRGEGEGSSVEWASRLVDAYGLLTMTSVV